MPSFRDYQKLYSGVTNGQIRKNQSDIIMEATWDEDISSRVAYFFDYYHDDYKTQLRDFEIEESNTNLIPVDIKFLQNSSQTLDKDVVSFHIQLKPSHKCAVDYYDKFFAKRYNATYPCGLYCLIPDEKGIYQRWLVVAKANYNVTQFPTFDVLPCDKVFRWIHDGKKYEMAGVLRSQNSYKL